MTHLQLYRLSGWLGLVVWMVVFYVAFQHRKILIKNHLSLFIYIASMLVLEWAYMILALLQIRNLFLDYFYKTIEFICLGWFLQSIIGSKILFRLNLIISFVFIVFQIFNAFWGSGYVILNDTGNLINTVYLSIFSFGVLVFLIHKVNINLQSEQVFLNISSAIFLIFLTDLLFDYLLKFAYEEHNNSVMFNILIIRNLFKSAYLLLFIRGIKKM